MTNEEELGVCLRMIQGCRALIPERDKRTNTRKFSRLLDLYSQDTIRRIQGRTPRLDDLPNIVLGLKLVDDLLEPFSEKRSELLGWYVGTEPQNLTQSLYGTIFSAGMAFSEAKQELESRWVN